MATSAATLSLIIDELLKTKPETREDALEVLNSKGLLPKKLLETPKVKKSPFASKAAEDFAEANRLDIDGLPGTGSNGRITVKDLKAVMSAEKPAKVNASPAALQFARDNNLDISQIASGSGNEGKIVLKDVKELKVPDEVETGKKPEESEEESEEDSEEESEESKPSPTMEKKDKKITAIAAKLMKQYSIDEEDIEEIDGTGKDGAIVAADLKELIDMIKQEQD